MEDESMMKKKRLLNRWRKGWLADKHAKEFLVRTEEQKAAALKRQRQIDATLVDNNRKMEEILLSKASAPHWELIHNPTHRYPKSDPPSPAFDRYGRP